MPAAIALIERTVNVNSGTLNVAGVRRVGELYRPLLDSLGFTVRWAEVPASMKRAGHLVAERKGTRGKRILIIGHLDTVFEPSSGFQTFRRDSTTAYGPGVSDMKGGNAIALHALKALQQAGALDGAQITIVFTGDEELPGEPLAEARKALIDAAKRSDIALEFEELITDSTGDWVTIARRSSTGWKLEVTGRGAHSSGIFGQETGAGAIYEAARILNGFYQEIRGEPGATFSPGVIVGGTDVAFDAEEHQGTAAGKDNIVARTAVASGDIRTITNRVARAGAQPHAGDRGAESAAHQRHASRSATAIPRWPPPTPTAGWPRRSTGSTGTRASRRCSCSIRSAAEPPTSRSSPATWTAWRGSAPRAATGTPSARRWSSGVFRGRSGGRRCSFIG